MYYYKEINDQTVYSECKTIKMPDGRWVSNPSEEQIAEAGWLPYVLPEVEEEPEQEPDNAG